MDETQVALSISELKLQIGAIDNRMEKIESKLDQIVLLDKTIAELSVHHENDSSEMQTMWSRIDSISLWKETHEREGSDQRAKVIAALEENAKTFRSSCVAIEGKVDSWINRGRGAIWTSALFLGLIQTIAFASIGWAFNHINTLEEHVLRIEAKSEHVDRDLTRVEAKIQEWRSLND